MEFDNKDYGFLVSCSVGDGHINRKTHTTKKGLEREYYALQIVHAVRQSDYLHYKADRINKILGMDKPVKNFMNGRGFPGNPRGYPAVKYQISSFALKPVFQLVYGEEGKKRYTQEVLDVMGLEGLSLLWMDDGSLTIRRKKTKAGTMTNGARLGYLSTYTDTPEESELVGEWISSLTGVLPRLQPSKGKYRLMFNSHDLRAFCPIIDPFVIPAMKYKTDCKWINQRRSNTTPEMFIPAHMRNRR